MAHVKPEGLLAAKWSAIFCSALEDMFLLSRAEISEGHLIFHLMNVIYLAIKFSLFTENIHEVLCP